MRAVVVFHDGLTDHPHWLAFLLRRGFRHTFCAILNGDYWITIDGKRGVPDVEVVAGADYDLADFYRLQGFTVVETRQQGRPLLAPVVANNCVGLVKATLCLRTAALTPYQLYRHLKGKSHATDAGIWRRRSEAAGTGPASAASAPDAHPRAG